MVKRIHILHAGHSRHGYKMHDTTTTLFQTFTEIGILHQLSQAVLKQALPDGMTTAQFDVLNHLIRLPGLHAPSQMASAFQLTKGAMTHTLGLLHKNGWVSIESHPTDGRSKQVDITQKGRDAHADAQVRIVSMMSELLSVTADIDMENLNKNLATIRIFMDAARN